MAFEYEWVQFFREQYPLKSRIRLRDLQSKEQSFRPRKMGTLEAIKDDGRFRVHWTAVKLATYCLVRIPLASYRLKL